MIVNSILGNIFHDKAWEKHSIDYLELEWYELNKRVMRKTTTNMLEIGVNINQENIAFSDGDILGINQDTIIVVNVKPCECIAIKPKNNLELARICYEIGNRHAPLFIDEHDPEVFLLAMDNPLMLMLKKIGAEPICVMARLVNGLSSNKPVVQHHQH